MLVVYFTWQFWFIWLQVESEGHVVNGLCACSVSVHGWCITFMTAPPSTCDKRPFSPTVLSSPFQGVKKNKKKKTAFCGQTGPMTCFYSQRVWQSRVLAGFAISPGLHQWRCVSFQSACVVWWVSNIGAHLSSWIQIYLLVNSSDIYTGSVVFMKMN